MLNPCYIIFTLFLVFSLGLLAAVICMRFINIPSIISGKKKDVSVMTEKRRT